MEDDLKTIELARKDGEDSSVLWLRLRHDGAMSTQARALSTWSFVHGRHDFSCGQPKCPTLRRCGTAPDKNVLKLRTPVIYLGYD